MNLCLFCPDFISSQEFKAVCSTHGEKLFSTPVQELYTKIMMEKNFREYLITHQGEDGKTYMCWTCDWIILLIFIVLWTGLSLTEKFMYFIFKCIITVDNDKSHDLTWTE